MANAEVKWWRDLFIIPIFVGLIVATFTYGLPILFPKKKGLSYSIDGPTTYLEPKSVGKVTIAVNGIPTSHLISYKVRIWNSGNFPLKDLPVLFAFDTDNKNFEIFSVSHDTKPRYEFGKITETEGDNCSKRFVFELLNQRDEDVVTFLTNDSPLLTVYAKQEDLVLNWVRPTERERWLKLASVVLAIITSFFSVLLADIGRRSFHLTETFWVTPSKKVK